MAEGNYYNAVESAISLGISFFINTFVITTFAVWVIQNNPTPEEIKNTDNLTGAAEALKVHIGSSAKYIWAFGLLAAG